MPTVVEFSVEQRRLMNETLNLANKELERATSHAIFGPVLRDLGKPGRAYLKSNTPVGTRPIVGRIRLRRAIRMATRKYPDGNTVLFLGYFRRNSGVRFKQRLAVEYGSLGRQGLRIIERAGQIITEKATPEIVLDRVTASVHRLIERQSRKAEAAARVRR